MYICIYFQIYIPVLSHNVDEVKINKGHDDGCEQHEHRAKHAQILEHPQILGILLLNLPSLAVDLPHVAHLCVQSVCAHISICVCMCVCVYTYIHTWYICI